MAGRRLHKVARSAKRPRCIYLQTNDVRDDRVNSIPPTSKCSENTED